MIARTWLPLVALLFLVSAGSADAARGDRAAPARRGGPIPVERLPEPRPGPGPRPGVIVSDDDADAMRDLPQRINVFANDVGVDRTTRLSIAGHPSHGSVTISAGKPGVVVYTPTPGFVGRDRFQYAVRSGRLGTVAIATVRVTVRDTLLLKGTVVDAGAGAAVAASVGGRTYRTVAGSDGGYSLRVAGSNAEMVTLSATSGQVALLSLPGSFGRLRQDAGSDRTLTRDENNQVQLTRLGTAMAYLLQLANDGAPFASEQAFDAAFDRVNTDEVIDMAAAIRLVADGTLPLPTGVASTLGLISDAGAYRRFMAQAWAMDADAVPRASAETVTDPRIVIPVPAHEWVGGHRMFKPAAPGSTRVGVYQGERLELAANGSGRYLEDLPTTVPGITWAVSGGGISVDLHSPRSMPYITAWEGQYVEGVRRLEGLYLAKLFDRKVAGRDLVGVVRRGRVSYPDYPHIPGRLWTITDIPGLAQRDGELLLPFLASEFPSERMLPIHRPEAFTAHPVWNVVEPYSGSGSAMHRFEANGTGRVLDDGQAFSWTIDAEGALRVTYGDGERVALRRLAADGNGGEGVFAEYLLPDGSVKATFELSAVRDGSLVFDEPGLARAWRTGFHISHPPHDADDDDGFHVFLDGPGQTGRTATVGESGVTDVQALAWQLDNGTMVARTYWSRSGWQAQCTVGVDGCYLYRERRWVPVARVGERILVREELWHVSSQGGPLGMTSQRANFYEAAAD